MTPDFVSGMLDKLIDAAPAIAVLLIFLAMIIALRPIFAQAIEQWGKNSERNAGVLERSNQAYERAAAMMREALDTERKFYGLQVEQVRQERQDVERHLKEDIKKLNDDNTSLTMQLAELRNVVEEKSRRIYDLERQLAETKRQADERGRERDKLKEKVDELTNELSEMRQTFESSLNPGFGVKPGSGAKAGNSKKSARARKEKVDVKTTS